MFYTRHIKLGEYRRCRTLVQKLYSPLHCRTPMALATAQGGLMMGGRTQNSTNIAAQTAFSSRREMNGVQSVQDHTSSCAGNEWSPVRAGQHVLLREGSACTFFVDLFRVTLGMYFCIMGRHHGPRQWYGHGPPLAVLGIAPGGLARTPDRCRWIGRWCIVCSVDSVVTIPEPLASSRSVSVLFLEPMEGRRKLSMQ